MVYVTCVHVVGQNKSHDNGWGCNPPRIIVISKITLGLSGMGSAESMQRIDPSTNIYFLLCNRYWGSSSEGDDPTLTEARTTN